MEPESFRSNAHNTSGENTRDYDPSTTVFPLCVVWRLQESLHQRPRSALKNRAALKCNIRLLITLFSCPSVTHIAVIN